MDQETYDAYVAILEEELVCAMGCTEPIAVAYCAALARQALGAPPERVDVAASANIIKNVKSVVVPNTGGARGIELPAIEFLNSFAVAECVPDLTILLDLPPEAGFARTSVRAETRGEHDRFEEEELEFHLRVREAFLAIARREPERVRTVGANRAPEIIHEEIRTIVDQLV